MEHYDAVSAPLQKSLYKTRSKWVGAYIGFIVAVLVATLALSANYPRADLVIPLLALSLPSLVAYLLLDFHVIMHQRREVSATRGLAAFLGLVPSLAAIAVLIAHFSVVGAVLFSVLIVFWALAIDRLVFLGSRSPKSQV